jgi:hypothetical protein
MDMFVKECLRNRNVWLFAVAYFFVYVIRQGVTSWFMFYLLEARTQCMQCLLASLLCQDRRYVGCVAVWSSKSRAFPTPGRHAMVTLYLLEARMQCMQCQLASVLQQGRHRLGLGNAAARFTTRHSTCCQGVAP